LLFPGGRGPRGGVRLDGLHVAAIGWTGSTWRRSVGRGPRGGGQLDHVAAIGWARSTWRRQREPGNLKKEEERRNMKQKPLRT
jgi:hypothetical protein